MLTNSSASSGPLVATSPRFLRGTCAGQQCAAFHFLSLNQLQSAFVISAQDLFGQDMRTLSSGTCKITVSNPAIAISGGIADVVAGRSSFSAVYLHGQVGRLYNVTMSCTFDGYTLVVEEPSQLTIQVERNSVSMLLC
jgi:hypothetical protein